MLSMGNPVISRRSAILGWNFKMRLCTSIWPLQKLFMHRHYLGQVIQYWALAAERSPYVKYWESCYFPLVGHLGPRIQNEAMYISRLLETLFMHRHYLGQVIQYWDLTAERSPYAKYEESRNFPQVGHLGLEFQNVVMYIKGPLQTLFTLRHVELRSLTPEIWLQKGLHMLSMGNPVISRWSAILDREFKMRLCTSIGNKRHCSCIGIT